MKIQSGKNISFPQPIAGMLKPFRHLYFAGFTEREKLLEILEVYSLRPARFEERQTGLLMPIPKTEDFVEFRFCGMFRNLIMLPDCESRLDLLAIRNLPNCFHQPGLQFRQTCHDLLKDYKGKLVGLSQFYGQSENWADLDFFGSRWMVDEISDDLRILGRPGLKEIEVKKREFRLRLCCFRNCFRFELREKQGDVWQSDPELYLSGNESQILLFLILTARNTGIPLAELMSVRSYKEAQGNFRDAWNSLRKLFMPLEQPRYRQRTFDGSEREEIADFTRVMRLLESTGFSAGSRRDRVPFILDETALQHTEFSFIRWNLLIGHFVEWIYPDTGILIPA
jgi:hypothetical protein